MDSFSVRVFAELLVSLLLSGPGARAQQPMAQLAPVQVRVEVRGLVGGPPMELNTFQRGFWCWITGVRVVEVERIPQAAVTRSWVEEEAGAENGGWRDGVARRAMGWIVKP